MFISVLELFKIGIGPSSSHTMGPMIAAGDFLNRARAALAESGECSKYSIRCTLKGSLAYTGQGHGTDRAVALGLRGIHPGDLSDHNLEDVFLRALGDDLPIAPGRPGIPFSPERDIVFDRGTPLPEHPNGMIFELFDPEKRMLLRETYFSIGGGFISRPDEIKRIEAPLKMKSYALHPYPFDSARSMLEMSEKSGLSIAAMKQENELIHRSAEELDAGLDAVWNAMRSCLSRGLSSEGILPGGLELPRRAKNLHEQLKSQDRPVDANDWLCAYAMAVNEENAAGRMVVTAPTNGAAGVIPAVLYYFTEHEGGTKDQVRDFLLTAAALGGLIKHRSSISGAEAGCQGEVGSAAAMAAAGLCAARGGDTHQIEHAAEIALEHHLGMTCDPVRGLVQVPCIERNGFGAVKAYTAAGLALRGDGRHLISLDQCIEAMRKTGLDMSEKYKETSLGGLALSVTEC